MTFHVPHNFTYNDLLTEFTDTKYHWASRVAVIKSIKGSFKKLTGYGINELVSGSNYQQVIDTLSNAKIPHCTFADWLRKYEWKTPQQSEANEQGNTFAAHVAQSEADIAKLEASNMLSEPQPQPQPQPVMLLDVFVTAYGKDHESYRYMHASITDYKVKHGYSHPWLEVTPEMYEMLKKWISVTLPELDQIKKLC